VIPLTTTAVVLGIAQDAGHPQAGCAKACCTKAWAGEGHRVSSVALVEDDKHWLLDATPDLPEQLHGLEGELAGILLTHAHMGHYAGLLNLGREAMGAEAIAVWAMPRMRTFLSENGPWDQLVRLENIVIQPLADGESVALSPTLSVTPVEVPHRDEYSETVGFHVAGPERELLYLPDIDKWEKWETPIEDWIRRVDVAMLDGTFFDGDELPGRDMSQIPHPFIVESIERFAPLEPTERDKVRFIHLNHTNPALDGASPASKRIQDAGHHVAREGETIPL